MKKTLVALAALATVGAAFAQSSVTLYGKVDLAVASQTQKLGGVSTATGNGGPQIGGTGVALQNSRWGMKGTEDLGGGMSAIFQLENGFDPNNGQLRQGGLEFGRQAFAGLKGNWGQVTGGRQYGIIDTVTYSYDPQGGNNVSALAYAWFGGPNAGIIGLTAPANAGGAITNGAAVAAVTSTGAHNDPARYNNTINYTSPNMGGFTGQLMWAPGESKNPVTRQSAGGYYGALVDYSNGPIGISLGYDNTKTSNVGAPAATASDWSLSGSYDFGAAKLYGGYQRARANAAVLGSPTTGGVAIGSQAGTDKGWQLGAGIPIGVATLAVAWAQETQSSPGLVDGKVSAFSASLKYPFSKRTFAYTSFLVGKDRPAAASAAASSALQVKNSTVNFGVQTNF